MNWVYGKVVHPRYRTVSFSGVHAHGFAGGSASHYPLWCLRRADMQFSGGLAQCDSVGVDERDGHLSGDGVLREGGFVLPPDWSIRPPLGARGQSGALPSL